MEQSLGRTGLARLASAAVATVVIAASAGCSVAGYPSSGDDAALMELKRLQRSLLDEATSNFQPGSDPVVLARWAVNDTGQRIQGSGDPRPFQDRVEALSWSSVNGTDGVVELRISVTTPGYEDHSLGGHSYGPGSAQRCVRIHVGAADDSVVTIDCAGRPAVAVPPAPEPAPPLDEEKLRRAMSRGDSLAAVEAAARRAFPDQSVTASTDDGLWVVVVVREAPDLTCMGGTRDRQGRVTVSTAPRVRPGEDDCGADRFVHGPVYGH